MRPQCLDRVALQDGVKRQRWPRNGLISRRYPAMGSTSSARAGRRLGLTDGTAVAIRLPPGAQRASAASRSAAKIVARTVAAAGKYADDDGWPVGQLGQARPHQVPQLAADPVTHHGAANRARARRTRRARRSLAVRSLLLVLREWPLLA